MKAKWLNTPIGKMIAVADDVGLYMLDFADSKNIDKKIGKLAKNQKANIDFVQNKIIEQIEGELQEYFSGNLQEFKTRVFLTGSEFQNLVWKNLQEIKYGATSSYANLAKKIGNDKAVRAVANANGANLLPIIIPCHRIIGKDGNLTGYSGGLERKGFLLELENGLN